MTWWRRWEFWAALAVGLALRLWFVRFYASVSEDTLLYGDIAQNLLKHGVYGRSTDVAAVVRPTLIRLPGYPLFLAALFAVFGVAKYGAVILVQVALDLWTCLLLGGVAKRMFGVRAALAAVWLGAVCPFMANYAAAPLTETPTLFCMALAFYGLVRWSGGIDRWVGVIGFGLAWGVLLRPEQGLVAACVLLGMIWRGKGALIAGGDHFVGFWTLRVFRGPLIVCAVVAAPLVGWGFRNLHTMHVFQPLAPRYATDPGEFNPYGFQRWYRTWAIDFASTDQVYWNYDSAQISIADLPNRAFDSNEQYAQTEAVLADYNQTTTASPELDAKFAAIAQDRVKTDPIRYYLALPLARVINMIFRPRGDNLPVPLDWWAYREHKPETIYSWAYALLNLAYLVLAWVGFRRKAMWQAWKPVVYTMVGTVVLRALLLLNMDNSEPRYTLEFYPVLIVLASVVFVRGVTTYKATR